MKFGDGLDIQIKRQHLNICTTRTEKVKPSVELRKHQFYIQIVVVFNCLQKMVLLLNIKKCQKPYKIRDLTHYNGIGVTGFEEFALSKKYVNTLFFEGVF